MHCVLFSLAAMFFGNPAQVSAQASGSPYTTITLTDLAAFKPTAGNWKIAGDVTYDWKVAGKGKITSGKGILVNDLSDKAKDHLVTMMEHGDIDLELDFMMEKGSNAGVYLQGRYEVQMFDSWGVSSVKSTDCGAIYERWDDSRPAGRQGYEGHPPAQNVSRAPGLWQHYRIEFRAPRFDTKGKKVENARFIKVVHNGVVIHENVEVTGPTRASLFADEKSAGPIVIQGDHGAVAIRNIKYKAYTLDNVTLSNLTLNAYEGKFSSLAALDNAKPSAEMKIDLLQHQGTETMDNYGGRINGTINIPKSGRYYIDLNLKWIPDDTHPEHPNGGGQLKLGDKVLITIDGRKNGRGSSTIDLEAGQYPIQLSYYKLFGHWYQRANDIVFGIEGPGIAHSNLNAVLLFAEAVGAIEVPVSSEPVMLRSFVNHGGKKKTHVISVCEAPGISYSYDLQSGTLLQCWRGSFAETTLMWHDRGEPQLAEPLGSLISFPGRPAVAMLKDKSVAWPDSSTNYNYLGYDISSNGHPIIKYTVGDLQVNESLQVEDGQKLSHTVSVSSPSTSEVWSRIAEGSTITKLPNGLYAVNDKEYYIQIPDKSEALIRKVTANTMELLVPLRLKDKKASFIYSIIW